MAACIVETTGFCVFSINTYQRNKKNIGMKDLSRGICSVAVLQRLERGERIPDFFLLERIVERLGISMNKVEFLYDEQSYNIYYLREMLEKYLLEKEYQEAEMALKYYEGLKEAAEPLHRQYICKIKAVIEEECYKNSKKSCDYLKEAMVQTVPDFLLENLENYILGEGELILVLMWLKAKDEAGEMEILPYSKLLIRYIERTFSDEEVLANVYSKAAWIFAKAFISKNRKREALELCVRSEELLTGNGLLLHLPQCLELILNCEKDLDETSYEDWKRQREALRWIYEEYGGKYETEKIELWKNYRINELYFVSELIGQERKVLKRSQEKMADELEIDQKTISRIENGKYKPKPGTFEKMKEYLEFDRDICNTHVVVEDFALLELEREITIERYYKRFEEAAALYKRLKPRLSMEYSENRQYVMFMDIYFQKIYGEITEADAIRGCMEAFKVTRKNGEIEDLDKVVLSKNESSIINYIALMYDELGKKEECIKLLEKARAGYENSKVDRKHHYEGSVLIHQNLCGRYEENNQFEEALRLCELGIKFDIRCGCGMETGWYVMQKAYTEERKTGDKKASQYYYRQAYQILRLMRKDWTINGLKAYYEKNYGEVLA